MDLLLVNNSITLKALQNIPSYLHRELFSRKFGYSLRRSDRLAMVYHSSLDCFIPVNGLPVPFYSHLNWMAWKSRNDMLASTDMAASPSEELSRSDMLVSTDSGSIAI